MHTWIVLFRGINVGGKNIIPMAELRALFEDLGFKQVKSYIQSGNVICQSLEPDPVLLRQTIGDAVHARFGVQLPIIILSQSALKAAFEANPFPEADADTKSLHLYFLSAEPAQPDLAAMTKRQTGSEYFRLIGSVFYLYAPEGIGRSKLAAQAEKLLGVDATARNGRSVNKILELAGAV